MALEMKKGIGGMNAFICVSIPRQSFRRRGFARYGTGSFTPPSFVNEYTNFIGENTVGTEQEYVAR